MISSWYEVPRDQVIKKNELGEEGWLPPSSGLFGLNWSLDSKPRKLLKKFGGQGRNRTADASLFRAALYRLSYLAEHPQCNKVAFAETRRGSKSAKLWTIKGDSKIKMKQGFHRLAQQAAEAVGSPWAFSGAAAITILWAATGSYFRYSDTWQLVINTGTSVATFLIVFLIQNTQNRDAKVIHLKLDELIRAVTTARSELVQMESLSDDELEDLQKNFLKVRDRATRHLETIESSRAKRSRSDSIAPPQQSS